MTAAQWLRIPLIPLILVIYLAGMSCIMLAALIAYGPAEAARQWRERP